MAQKMFCVWLLEKYCFVVWCSPTWNSSARQFHTCSQKNISNISDVYDLVTVFFLKILVLKSFETSFFSRLHPFMHIRLKHLKIHHIAVNNVTILGGLNEHVPIDRGTQTYIPFRKQCIEIEIIRLRVMWTDYKKVFRNHITHSCRFSSCILRERNFFWSNAIHNILTIQYFLT